jgi:hypothetical protein
MTARRRVARAAKRSRTIFGVLVAFAGTVAQVFQDAVVVVLGAAKEIEQLQPAIQVATGLGITPARALFGITIAGLALSLFAKLDDEAKGRVVK